MRRDNPRLLIAGLTLATVAALAFAVAAEAAVDRGWRLRFYAASIDFDDSSGLGGGANYDADFGVGLGVNAEYRFSRRLGVDLGVLGGAGADFQSRTARIGQVPVTVHDTLIFTPLTAGIDIHLTPDRKVDLYVCPQLALVRFGGLLVRVGDAGTSTRLDFDDDLAVGAAVGVGVPFGQGRWSFQALLTHLDSRLDGTDRDGFRLDADQDATIFGLGFGYSF